MKRMMRPVPVKVWTDEEGNLNPYRFTPEAIPPEVRIENIVERSTSKIAGKLVQVFVCENNERRFELQYDYAAHRWYLTKW